MDPPPSDAAPPVEALVPLTRLLRRLDRARGPRAALVCGPPPPAVRRLVALPGSFNPPHDAHLALLPAGVAAAGADRGVFVLSARTVDKERVTGMLLEDRLWLLCRLCWLLGSEAGTADAGTADAGTGGAGDRRSTARERARAERAPVAHAPPRAGAAGRIARGATGEVPARGWASVVATNRGLYVEQARALRGLYPGLEALVFVVGFDKIVQILDARYYDDRDAALEELFGLARFLVAPRDAQTVADVRRLLAQPENARFAGGVAPLPLSPALARVSSTEARGAAAAGGAAAHVPELVARFIAETGCYRPSEERGDYERRAAALAAAARAAPGERARL